MQKNFNIFKLLDSGFLETHNVFRDYVESIDTLHKLVSTRKSSFLQKKFFGKDR